MGNAVTLQAPEIVIDEKDCETISTPDIVSDAA